jgi:hypothetical protein
MRSSALRQQIDDLLRGPVLVGYCFPFALVVYLSLQGGGYDTIVRGELGVIAWWLLLVAGVGGLLHGRRLGLPAEVAILLLAAFATWTTLGALWGESAERGIEEGARVATYGGVLVIALLVQGPDMARRFALSIAAAIGLVGVLALLSRLQPQWFPDNVTAEIIPATASRISYPLNYWNAVAAICAIGLPLMLWAASSARSQAARAIAAAVAPALVLTIFLTLSRGGTLIAVAGVAVFVALYPIRSALLPALATTAIAGGGLILAASHRTSLADGLDNELARSQGDTLLLMLIVACLLVAGVHVLVGRAIASGRIGGFPRMRRPLALKLAGAGALAIVVAGIALGAPGRLADGFEEFKQPVDPGETTTRLESVSGNGRWQYWSAAARAGESEPLVGIGPGSYEFWWSREGSLTGPVRDAHSLYAETFAELGIVGLILVLAFVGVILFVATRETLQARGESRTILAALTAAAWVFALGAGIDWIWELAALPVVFMLIAAPLLSVSEPPGGSLMGPRWRNRALSAGGALLIVAGLLVVAVPLLANSHVRTSKELVTEGDLAGALEEADAAEDLQPYATTPLIQAALVLELEGELDEAAARAREATELEPTNWKHWFLLSRLEAQRDKATAAVKAYREARRLNPDSPLFN